MAKRARVNLIQRGGRSTFTIRALARNTRLTIIYSNVNNTGNKGVTDRVTISLLARQVGRGFQPRRTPASARRVLTDTVTTTGVTMFSQTRGSRALDNVNAAIIITVAYKSATCVSRIKSDQLCLYQSNRLSPMAQSRSIIRRLVRDNRVGRRRTHSRPQQRFVAHTLNIASGRYNRCSRLAIQPKSGLLLYASKLAGVIKRSFVRRVLGSGTRSRTIRTLVRTTLSNNNASGVATILLSL